LAPQIWGRPCSDHAIRVKRHNQLSHALIRKKSRKGKSRENPDHNVRENRRFEGPDNGSELFKLTRRCVHRRG